MELTDEQKIALGCKVLTEAVANITKQDSHIKAVLLATDGDGLFVAPLRMTKEETYALLMTAAVALEQDPTQQPGELH